MAIEKRVIFDRTEVLASGVLQVRLRKQIIEDGKEIFGEPHRFVLEPDVPLDQLVQAVNVDLAALGYPALGAEAVARVRRLAVVEHTPDVVSAYATERKARG